MLTPKKVIPSLAVAALPLTGTGCGDSATENLANGISAFCMKLVECYPAYYNLEECVSEYGDYLVEYADMVSDGCINVVASYFQCVGGVTCEEFENGAYYQCYLDLEDDFIRECDLDAQ